MVVQPKVCQPTRLDRVVLVHVVAGPLLSPSCTEPCCAHHAVPALLVWTIVVSTRNNEPYGVNLLVLGQVVRACLSIPLCSTLYGLVRRGAEPMPLD